MQKFANLCKRNDWKYGQRPIGNENWRMCTAATIALAKYRFFFFSCIRTNYSWVWLVLNQVPPKFLGSNFVVIHVWHIEHKCKHVGFSCLVHHKIYDFYQRQVIKCKLPNRSENLSLFLFLIRTLLNYRPERKKKLYLTEFRAHANNTCFIPYYSIKL